VVIDTNLRLHEENIGRESRILRNGRQRKRVGRRKKYKRPTERAFGESMILSGLVFLTDTGENVKHFTQSVNQTQNDGHYHRYHDYGEYQTFQ
jgi:hypothetical protein